MFKEKINWTQVIIAAVLGAAAYWAYQKYTKKQ